MNLPGFLLLLAIAVVIRYLGRKYAPLIVPVSRTKTLVAALVGGVVGHLIGNSFLRLGPQVADIYVVPAVILALFLVFLVGVGPFIRIMFSRP